MQITLDDKENEIVSIYKIKKRLKTKADAIKKIIRERENGKGKNKI